MQVVFNWHITERCNYSCHYCFAKWERGPEVWSNPQAVDRILSEISTAPHLPALEALANGDMTPRLNFAGGEPLILGSKLNEIAQQAVQNHGIECSIITNGSLLAQNIEIVRYLSMVGISIDSLCRETNEKIGRVSRNGASISYDRLNELVHAARLIKPNLSIKFNTVVNQHNWNEKMLPELRSLQPDKIKVFRQMPFRNQDGISTAQFDYFLEQNDAFEEQTWIEDNQEMTHSYLMIDPLGRLFENGDPQKYGYSWPIHEAGLKQSISQISFNMCSYNKRYLKGHTA